MKILLITLLLPIIVFSQNKYINITDYPDKKTVEKVKAKSPSVSFKLLVYQPASDEHKPSSIVVIQNKTGTHYWVIKNDSVLTSGRLKNSNKIFSYKNYLKTGATSQEDKLKFIPPLMNGIETENVIYEDARRKFYFEYGKNVTGYSPDIQLDKYRKEWIELIRHELNSVLGE